MTFPESSLIAFWCEPGSRGGGGGGGAEEVARRDAGKRGPSRRNPSENDTSRRRRRRVSKDDTSYVAYRGHVSFSPRQPRRFPPPPVAATVGGYRPNRRGPPNAFVIVTAVCHRRATLLRPVFCAVVNSDRSAGVDRSRVRPETAAFTRWKLRRIDSSE